MLIGSLYFVFSLAVCGTEKASATECDLSYELIQSQKAPCNGILWPKIWTMQALACVEADLPEATQERDATKRLLNSCGNSLTKLQEAHTKALGDLETIARNAAGLNASPWYEHPTLWFGLGLAGGAGLVVFLGTL